MNNKQINYKNMNYSDFCLTLAESENFELVLDYGELFFRIYKDLSENRYFYLEYNENDASDFYEVELLARLIYDVNHDLKIPHHEAGMVMSELFECDCCGEVVYDDHIEYLWFKNKRHI